MIKNIKTWLEINDLKLATEKTEAVIIKGPRDRERIVFKLDKSVIVSQKTVFGSYSRR